MKRLMITGVSGFVSRHLITYLNELGADIEVLGVARSAPNFPTEHLRHVRYSFRCLDLLDKDGVDEVIYAFRPTHIVHLAAYSSVGFSWQKPVESFRNNTNVLLHLLEKVRTLGLQCRVLSVGSSEQYGDLPASALPLKEESPQRPVSPYAVARVAQELLSEVYVRGYGLDVVMTRSFNHIGPYQRDAFVVASLTRQLTAVRYRGAPQELVTGDRTIVRDFVDVRDVVRAYVQLLELGKSGEVYNVCSGRGTSIQDVIDLAQDILGTEVVLRTDPRLIRPNDNRAIVGSNAKIRGALGWEPAVDLRESLESIVEYWRHA